MKNRLMALCLVGSLALVASQAEASRLYRYNDAKGHPVISNTMPDDAVSRGYEVLDSSGHVVERIAPAPTAEELRQKAQEEAQAKARQQQEKQQEKSDALLLRTYSSPDDAVRALYRKMQEMHSLIRLKQSNIAILQGQLAQEQEKAANLERSGQKVPAAALERMQHLKEQMASVKQEVRDQRREVAQVRKNYEDKISRLETLTGDKRTLPLQEPSSANDASADKSN